jgi:hypothetical protein
MGENCISAKGEILKNDENLATLASIFFLKKKKGTKSRSYMNHHHIFSTIPQFVLFFWRISPSGLFPFRINSEFMDHIVYMIHKSSFLYYRQSVGPLGWVISQSQGCYLRRTTQKQKKRRHIFMPRVGFEPTIPVFERAKTSRALDSTASCSSTAIGHIPYYNTGFPKLFLWWSTLRVFEFWRSTLCNLKGR